MKRILTSFALVAASVAFSQVSIAPSEVAPQATLDVNAIGSGATADGILVPRVDRSVAQGMANVQESTLIYVSDVDNGSQTGQAVYIDSPGFYYFLDGAWNKIVKAQKKLRLGQVASPSYNWDDPSQGGWADYYEFTSGTPLALPNPAENAGRTIYIRRKGGGSMFFAGADGIGTPVNLSSISAVSAIEVYSDGNKWYLMAGRN